MCACGCFFLAVVAAGFIWCALNHLWLPAALIVIGAVLAGWFGRKAIVSPKAKS